MTTYISMLRGINVSGQKMIKMEALRNMFEEMKFNSVQSYIQSGNIIFVTGKQSTTTLEKKINTNIMKYFGFDVPVTVKEMSEFKTIVNANPFLKLKNKDSNFFHITFLSSVPDSALIRSLKTGNYNNDEFEVTGSNIFLYCPGGYGNTKLTNTFFESKLKVHATTRNWKTALELLRMAEATNKE